ncbi:alanine racemase [Salipiger sp. P9]|uniref:alanine racemase n=1 Tax=Salipiger pentaromativorans TaxID=2943193 RepID=UPI00215890A9|nr:alanine racemase [Salipiger pentaromativorans]MCR8546913.1 alanine racemase [Salipiger pentaromativorans]
MPNLSDRDTPFLALDRDRMDRNVARMRDRAEALGVTLRPHLKTVKSVPAAQRILGDMAAPATVSTLQEAEAFAEAGCRDLIYAVGIAPAKLPRVLAMRQAGTDLAVILDNAAQAEAVCAASRAADAPIPALIEIDSDGMRAGLAPDDPRIVALGRRLVEGGAELRGVLTHGGASYGRFTDADRRAMAAQERDAAVAAATALRAAGLACPVVSVGSTPSAAFATDLTGVTELRAGVYTLSDLMMAGLGVGGIDDIALSVVATVIGHQEARGWILTDAGFMALSRDRGTAGMPVDQGFGLVADLDGVPFGDLIVQGTSQEHGILAMRPGSSAPLPDLPVGTRLRIYPNHACATVGMHPAFAVTEGGQEIVDDWPILRGW